MDLDAEGLGSQSALYHVSAVGPRGSHLLLLSEGVYYTSGSVETQSLKQDKYETLEDSLVWTVSWFAFHCCGNIMTKSYMGRRCLVWLPCPDHSVSLRQGKIGPPARQELQQRHAGRLLATLLPMACSAAFLHCPGRAARGRHHP